MKSAPLLAVLLVTIAGLNASQAAAGVQVSGATDTLVVAPSAVFTLDIVVPQAGDAFNAFSMGLHFDAAKLTFVPPTPNKDVQRGPLLLNACSNTFHIFSVAPDSLKIELSLLCNQVSVTGPGVLYRVKFQAGPSDAITSLKFGPSTRFLLGGAYQAPVLAQSIVVRIGNPLLDVNAAGRPDSGVQFSAPSPNPARSQAPMTMRFTVPRSDLVSFLLLDPLGRRIAARSPQAFDAGPHTLGWALPALAPGRYSVVLSTAGGERRTQSWTVLR